MSTHLELPPVVHSMLPSPALSDEEFEQLCFCADAQLERTREGKILVNPPAAGFTGDSNSEIIYQLRAWWKQHRRGRTFDCNTGFFLPYDSMFSPDAAYVVPERLRGLTPEAGAHFLRLCPNFVIELLSASDRLRDLRGKMENWIQNGSELAWLVDPYQKRVYVYEPGQGVRIETGLSLAGKGPVEGFNFDLAEVWQHYEPDAESTSCNPGMGTIGLGFLLRGVGADPAGASVLKVSATPFY